MKTRIVSFAVMLIMLAAPFYAFAEDITNCIQVQPDDQRVWFTNVCKKTNIEVDVCGVRTFGPKDSDLNKPTSARTAHGALTLYHQGLSANSGSWKFRDNTFNPDTRFEYNWQACAVRKGFLNGAENCPATCPTDPSLNDLNKPKVDISGTWEAIEYAYKNGKEIGHSVYSISLVQHGDRITGSGINKSYDETGKLALFGDSTGATSDHLDMLVNDGQIDTNGNVTLSTRYVRFGVVIRYNLTLSSDGSSLTGSWQNSTGSGAVSFTKK